MTIRAVIFDVGGVLLRFDKWVREAAQGQWEMRLGLAEGELAEAVFDSETSMQASLGAATAEDVWNDFRARFDLSEAELTQLQRDFWKGDTLDVELLEFLRSLRPKYKTGILTNAWPGAREGLTERHGLHEAVDVIVVSAEERLAKPDPRIYERIAERLGVRPNEAVFVDDMLENVQAARVIGMKGVLFRDTAQAISEVRHYLQEGS